MGLYLCFHIGSDFLDLRSLEAEGGLVADEARRDGEDGLLDLKVILHQGLSRLHDVHDDVGQSQNGAISMEPLRWMMSISRHLDA